MLPVCYVTSYAPNMHCDEEFLQRATVYFPLYYAVDIANADEPKANQLFRLLGALTDEYVVLLEHDFFITHPVNIILFEAIWDFCNNEGADRFSLQSKNAHSYPFWSYTDKEILGNTVYSSNAEVKLPFSLEASIWRRKFLLENIALGENDAEIEINGSKRIRAFPTKIFALDTIVINYLDAIRS